VCGINHDDATQGDDAFSFNTFRFNDKSAQQPKELELRRTVPVNGFGERSTYNCNIPMGKETIFNVPPYNIFVCKMLVELQTGSKTYPDPDKAKAGKSLTSEVRPNLQVNMTDERELYIIRKSKEMNSTSSYELITPAPRVLVKYDKEKNYAPKYEVSYYMEVSPSFQLTTTFMPILAVVGLAMLNVWMAVPEGPDLENSIALAFTLVVLLPMLRPEGRASGDEVPWKWTSLESWKHLFLSGNTCILLLFAGLGMSSLANPYFYADARKELESNENTSHIPDEYIPFLSKRVEGLPSLGYAEKWGIAGMTLMWLGVLIPIINYFRYRAMRKYIVNHAKVKYQKDGKEIERLAFCKDGSFDKFDIEMDKKITGVCLSPQLENIVCASNSAFKTQGTKLDQWIVVKDDKKERHLQCGPTHEPLDLESDAREAREKAAKKAKKEKEAAEKEKVGDLPPNGGRSMGNGGRHPSNESLTNTN
jgi:hypothetical protein